jgi:hypothetical protein
VAPTSDNRYLAITNINGLLVSLSDSVKVNDGDEVFRVNAYTITLDRNGDGTPLDVDGDGKTSDGDGDPIPDLYICDNMDDMTDEGVCKVAEGIEDIQFQYGWDANNNGSIEDAEWQDAPAVVDEERIRAVRIYILARTLVPDPAYTDPNTSFTIADHDINLDTNEANGIGSHFDHHYHRVLLQETVLVRNKNL